MSTSNGTSLISEAKANRLRAQFATRMQATVRAAQLRYPDEATCQRIVNECIDLRRAGHSAIGEIDDVVGARHGISGALVQDICLYYAEEKTRHLEAAAALNKNIVDFIAGTKRNTFAECPGRSWK